MHKAADIYHCVARDGGNLHLSGTVSDASFNLWLYFLFSDAIGMKNMK